MQIKIKNISYDELMEKKRPKHKRPMKQSLFFRMLLRLVSIPDIIATGFRVKKTDMDKIDKNTPCLFLMNHSSFLDLEIAATVLSDRPYNIVCTTDAYIGKSLLMRFLGCIPTDKFVPDLRLIKDMIYAVKELKSSIVLFPEAGYSFDGRSTVLPESLGQFVKLLGVPVVMIETFGAYIRDPLYNGLQRRKVKVSAEMKPLLTKEEVTELDANRINELIRENFSFDNFKYQKENGIRVKEPFRADFLERILYKCPACGHEGDMKGEGIKLSCGNCKKEYVLGEFGELEATEGSTEFSHIPDWFDWQRAAVKEELENGSYLLDTEVDIYAIIDTSCLYRVGDGRLVHNSEGFLLTGCEGRLEYRQKPLASYTLNSDFYWYQIGDVIGIGNRDILYYCFPKDKKVPVAKARLAAEELYKIHKASSARRRKSTTDKTE
ncbi:MAG: hypothetical protein E7623_01435 [Ruminococcaceae bacterium]|nr:hypothetical protein [Oscillospiraceae bacterium]